MTLPIVDFVKPRPPFLPISIPSDIAGRLEKVHGEPHIWWVGQFVTYLLRMKPQTQALLDEAKSKMDISSPTVGYAVIFVIETVKHSKITKASLRDASQ